MPTAATTKLIRLSSRDASSPSPNAGAFINSFNNSLHTTNITHAEPVMVSFNNTFNNITTTSTFTVVYTAWDGIDETKTLTYSSATYIDAPALLTDLNSNCATTRSGNATSLFTQDSLTGNLSLTVTNVPSVTDSVARIRIFVTGSLVRILGFTAIDQYVASTITVTTAVNLSVPNFAPTDLIYVEMSHLATNTMTETGSNSTRDILCAIPMGKYARGVNVHWEPSCAEQYVHTFGRPIHLDKTVYARLLDEDFNLINPPANTHIDVVVKVSNNLLTY